MPTSRGPFRAAQVRPGDPYELSRGHAIECLPTGGRGSAATGTGFTVLRSDPDVDSAGVDTGFSPHDDTLRAPDIAVGNVPDEPGWVQGAPPLAVEYADTGQDDSDLRIKILELLAAGTQLVWVVRLHGPRRVEIHSQDGTMRLAEMGDLLEAPGILRNAVPVAALYDWEAGRAVTLRNLLQREGYESLDDVRSEGEARGEARGETLGRSRGEMRALRASIFDVLNERGLSIPAEVRQAIEGCEATEQLRRWLRSAVNAASAGQILER